MDGVIQTPSGRLRGEPCDAGWVFRGIPFARPPQGAMRFRACEPVAPWRGTRDALTHGPAAPQLSGMMSDLKEFSEDCLYLNVYTPGLDGRRRPVLVWLHGGGFTSGAGHQVIYDGNQLAKGGDVVVVTINYRLGMFGFLDLSAHLPSGHGVTANNGLRDQVMALRWVRDHIAALGGDPECVTLMGQSAGGMSIGSLMAVPQARGLFHRAVAQSGGAHHAVDADEAARMAEVFLQAVQIDPAHPEALWSLPFEQLMKGQKACLRETVQRGPSNRRLPQGAMTLLPSVDGDLLERQPYEIIESGQGAAVPLLAGSTRDEWNFFVLLTDPRRKTLDEAALRKVCARRIAPGREDVVDIYRAASPEAAGLEPWRIFAQVEGDRMFGMPSVRLAEAQSRRAATYMYRFDWESPLFDGEMGACHTVEVPFVFGTQTSPFGKAFSGGERPGAAELTRRVLGAWLAFARGGDPSHEGLGEWPTYEPGERRTMRLGQGCGVETRPMEVRRRFWDGIC